MKYSLGTEQQ
jgi:hypothetical protein